jgi:CRP-like cAMP-binding protein
VRQLIRSIPKPLELDEKDEDGLPSIPLFASLPKGAFIQILERMTLRRVHQEDVIVTEGEAGQSFFVVSEGRVRVEKQRDDGRPVTLAYLGEGSCFGEMSLIDSKPRSATVIADQDSSIFEVSGALLEETVERYPSVAKKLRDFYTERLLATTMTLHPFFDAFTPSERRSLAGSFRRRTFGPGEVLITEGKKSRGFFILLSGGLEVTTQSDAGTVRLAALEPGEMFGEMSLLTNSPTSATVRAVDHSIVLRLDKSAFEDVVDGRPEIRQLLSGLYSRRQGENEARLSSGVSDPGT